MRVTLLGPQRPKANLPAVLAEAGVRGPVALVSAGWRYDEDRDEPLRAELGVTVHNLRLYEAYAEVEREDPRLAGAYSRHQERVKAAKERYRLALVHAEAACVALWCERRDPTCAFFQATLAHLRGLDALFLAEATRQHEAFEAEVQPRRHPLVRATLARARDILRGCDAVLVAGGHVGVLRNRMAFFGVHQLFGDLPVFAWSAGAMALAEGVVLFHDHMPGGRKPPELLDVGLGLARGVIPLPHAAQRLALEDADLLRVLAARFAPARLLLQEPGSRWSADAHAGALTVSPEGRVTPWEAHAAPA